MADYDDSDATSDEDDNNIPRNPADLDGAPDLTQLLHLEMPNVTHNIRCRYDKKEIYTRCERAPSYRTSSA